MQRLSFCSLKLLPAVMTVSGTAQEHYEAGIAESHAFWGVEHGSCIPGTVRMLPVMLPAGKELIGTQKWLALYNRGNEGYAEPRIL